MNNIYTQLADVYEAMYHTFINYEEELDFYSNLLKNYSCTSLLEIGCGTGNLAPGFTRLGFRYWGLDLSSEMLKIARKKYPHYKFIEGDMTNFTLTEKPSASIITGRTISYLLKNKEVINTFTCINNNMLPKGIVCFDFIDADKFIPYIKDHPFVLHKASYKGKRFCRESNWQSDLVQSRTVHWQSAYYQEKENHTRENLGFDNSTIRAFCKDEMVLFLERAGFCVKEITCRKSYAFDTLVIVAEAR